MEKLSKRDLACLNDMRRCNDDHLRSYASKQKTSQKLAWRGLAHGEATRYGTRYWITEAGRAALAATPPVREKGEGE